MSITPSTLPQKLFSPPSQFQKYSKLSEIIPYSGTIWAPDLHHGASACSHAPMRKRALDRVGCADHADNVQSTRMLAYQAHTFASPDPAVRGPDPAALGRLSVRNVPPGPEGGSGGPQEPASRECKGPNPGQGVHRQGGVGLGKCSVHGPRTLCLHSCGSGLLSLLVETGGHVNARAHCAHLGTDPPRCPPLGTQRRYSGVGT